MLNTNKAFSSFSVNDIQKARNSMVRRLDSNFPAGRRAPLLYRSPAALKL